MPDTPIDRPTRNLEARFARLEEDMREVKAILARLEPIVARIDATLTATLARLQRDNLPTTHCR